MLFAGFARKGLLGLVRMKVSAVQPVLGGPCSQGPSPSVGAVPTRRHEPVLQPPLPPLAIASFTITCAGLKIWRVKRVKKQILNLPVLEDCD